MGLGNVELYNVGAVESIPGIGENCLVRVPMAVRNLLNERARFVGMDSVGCEVRFVTDAPNVDVVVASSKPEFEGKAQLRVFHGDFQCQDIDLEPGRVHVLRLVPPAAFANAKAEKLVDGGFAPNVWRLVSNRGGTLCVHAINTFGHELRPPNAAEKPPLDWLAYGSSITNSSLDGYPHFAARKLRVQVQNKGMSGSCQCEPELVDWLVDACKWDFATLELGINMRGGFSPEEFAARVAYTLKRFAATGRPVLVVDIFPNCFTPDIAADSECATARCEGEYKRIVEAEARRLGAANLRFVGGAEILDDFTGLSGDLLHPCGFGHAVMGANIARVLSGIVR